MANPFDLRAHAQAERYRLRVYRHGTRGAIAGVIGGAAIVVYLFAHDLLIFGVLATPEALTELLPGRQELSADITARLRAARIGAFFALHMAVFALLGVLLAILFRVTGARSKVLLGGLYGTTLCTLVLAGGVYLAGAELPSGWPPILLGNFVAGALMGAYLDATRSLHGLEDRRQAAERATRLARKAAGRSRRVRRSAVVLA